MGQGREQWERSEVGGVNDNEQHLCPSPVSNPMEELRKDKRRSEDRERQERTRPEFYFVFCERQSSLRGCCFSFMVVYFIIKVFKAGFHLLLPDLRTVLQLLTLTLMLFIHD